MPSCELLANLVVRGASEALALATGTLSIRPQLNLRVKGWARQGAGQGRGTEAFPNRKELSDITLLLKVNARLLTCGRSTDRPPLTPQWILGPKCSFSLVREGSRLGTQFGWACESCAYAIGLKEIGLVRADRVSGRRSSKRNAEHRITRSNLVGAPTRRASAHANSALSAGLLGSL